MAEYIVFSEYPLFSMSSFSFENCFSLYSGLEQILRIPKHNEEGIFVVKDGGWQELGRRYIFLSVSFLYRSVYIFPSSILQRTSRNGIATYRLHWHLSSSASFTEEVWFIGNLIDLCTWFISSNSLCSCFDVPWNIENISSRNLFNIFSGLLLLMPYFCAKLIIFSP